MQFTKLQVMERTEECDDVCSLFLEKPTGFDYHAGQHLPLRFSLQGKEVRRTYTLSSSPMDPYLQITVKRVKDGLVSNHINDNVQSGELVEARPPIGHIHVTCAPKNYRTLYLFAAGSGITPMWSMARTVLAQEPYSHIRLLYGNRSEDTIIFQEVLGALEEQYGNRFRVVHILSAPKKESWSALWRTDVINDARKGRVDEDALQWFVDRFRPISQECSYYICGPGAMNGTLRDGLLKMQVPLKDIHVEYFKAPTETKSTAVKGISSHVQIGLNGQVHSISVSPGKTLLQAALDAGLDPPYSCEGGVCATCRAKLLHGEVDMPSAPALEQKEIRQGMILTCQSWPNSSEIKLAYD